MSKTPSLVSIIATVYNEEDMLPAYFEALAKVLEPIKNIRFELLIVNDGSSDNSLSIAKEQLLKKAPYELKVISFSRNFGKESAISAGFDYASGDAAILMDSDLEDPVELIPQMIDKWVEGNDIVYTVRRRRVEGLFKCFFAWCFYKVINVFSDVHIYHNAGDYRLFDKKAVAALDKIGEKNRFSKGLFNWIGFKSTAIEYDRYAREKGETKWSFLQLWHYAMDGIISFSTVPLKFWIFIGMTVSFLSFSYAIFLIARTVLYGIDLPGYASTIVIMMFLNGIILVNLGILSEYIARIFVEVKNRPNYVVNELLDSTLESKN